MLDFASKVRKLCVPFGNMNERGNCTFLFRLVHSHFIYNTLTLILRHFEVHLHVRLWKMGEVENFQQIHENVDLPTNKTKSCCLKLFHVSFNCVVKSNEKRKIPRKYSEILTFE